MVDQEVNLDALKARLLALQASLSQGAWTDILGKIVAAMAVELESQYIVDATPPAEELFGYMEGELAGKPLEILIPRDKLEAHREHMQRFSANPTNRTMGASSSLDIVGRRRTGEEVRLVITLRSRMIGGARCGIAIITERF